MANTLLAPQPRDQRDPSVPAMPAASRRRVRSLRVPMDIGLNYYGWTDEEALSIWQGFSTGLDDIARREIARMRRWPAQVITYKYGAESFLRWQLAAAEEKKFNWLDFHTRVLQYGPLPLSLLDELIAKEKT